MDRSRRALELDAARPRISRVLRYDASMSVQSPILAIAANVPDSVIRGAPERAREVRALIDEHDLRFVLDNRPGFVFVARQRKGVNEVAASIQGLELLWSLSFAHYVLYALTNEARQRGESHADFSANTRAISAAALLEWAVDRAAGRVASGWPPHLPQPDETNGEVSDEAVATELYLCSTAWVFQHELAHHSLGHVGRADARLDDERNADAAATAWLLDAVPEDPRVRIKRGLGIVIALIALNVLDLYSVPPEEAGRTRSHPKAAERIVDALDHPAFADNDQVLDFAVVTLSAHLQRLGIDVPQEPHDTLRGDLASLCIAASRLQQRLP